MLMTPAASTPNLHNKEPAIDWHAQEFPEFVPETFGGPMVCASPSCLPVTLSNLHHLYTIHQLPTTSH
jgi:PAB-dependent poly(A)-specific ribonuclease subunit 3